MTNLKRPIFVWILVLSAGVVGAIFALKGFEWRAEQFDALGLTTNIPDVTHLMSSAYLHYFGWQLGESGRALYVKTQLGLDTLFPLSYVAVLCGLAYFFATGSIQKLLMRGAVLAGFFDLLENLLVILPMIKFPELMWLALPITICTSLKVFFLVVTGAILAPLTILGGLEKLKILLKNLSKKLL